MELKYILYIIAVVVLIIYLSIKGKFDDHNFYQGYIIGWGIMFGAYLLTVF